MQAHPAAFKPTLLATAMAAVLSPSVVWADTDSDQPPTNDAEALQVITVTADKLERDKQDVPHSISAFDGNTLDDLSVDTLEGVANHAANIGFYRADSHTTYLVYRGIGGTTNMNKVWNVNADGVTQPYVATDTLLDVERIEVLRGSQGAIYGRNTHAGVVNVITRDPTDVFSADATASYESYNTLKLNTAFGGPINTTSGYRIALGYRSSDGFFENTHLGIDDGNDHEQVSGRGKVVFAPNDGNKITLGLTADTFDGGFDSYVAGGGLKTENNEPGYNDGKLVSPTLTWEHDLGRSTLTSISAYSRSNYGFLHDWDFTSLDISTGEYDEIYNTVSQELRLEGETDGGLTWLAGAFFLAEDLDTETTMRLGVNADAWGLPPGMTQAQESTIETRGAALFGQAVFSPRPSLELTGRLRMDYEKKDLDWEGFADGSSFARKSFDEDWFALLPSVSIAKLLGDHQRLYASVSRGYKAGDYNNVQLDPTVITEAVDPEYTLTYEVGYKGLLANERIEFNAAVFYVDWEDLQVETPVTMQGALVYLKQNAAEAHSSGVELELRARPAPAWELFANAGYMFEYEFDDYPNSISGDLSGKHLPNANEFTVNLGTIYRNDNGWFASLDLAHNGAKFFDEANAFEQDAVTLLNAKLGYESEQFSAYLFGRNLLDEEYAISMFANAEMAGEPQIVGVQARMHY
ncbi:MAG TPA: hypothetical protein DD979_07910 [Gammaproteobacteria bacterium]|jgi:iron complex outermembrane receptor protein|nr:hypothetical protein [Gammaproteobacteria bacterium]